MPNEEHRISGRVIDHKSGRGIAGLSIEAWEKGWHRNKPVGGATTDGSGAFKI